MSIYDNETRRYINFNTAKKRNLFQNPSRFTLPNNFFVNKTTQKQIIQKSAEKLIRSGEGNKVLFNKNLMFINPYSSRILPKTNENIKKISKIIKQGKTRTTNQYIVKNYFKILLKPVELIRLLFEDETGFNKFIKSILQFYKSVMKNRTNKFSIVLEGSNERRTISTKYTINFQDAKNDLINKIEELAQLYDLHDITVKKIAINELIITNPQQQPQQQGQFGSSNKLEVIQTDKYTIISPSSYTNCLFHAWTYAENENNVNELLKNQDKLNNIARQLKQHINPTLKKLSNMETIQELVNYKNRTCIVLDSSLEIKETIQPIKNNKKSPIVIQVLNNHIRAVLNKTKINYFNDVNDDENNTTKSIKKSNFIKMKNDNIMVWDIETYMNKKEFKAYAVGLAFDNQFQYFWGEDCLIQFLEYLNINFDKFNGYTLYAHNGGNFDIPILIKEALIKYEDIKISTNEVVELNNSYIGFGLQKGDMKIKMKDSYALLPQSLDKLTNEMNVEHKKLSINHNDITSKNYNAKKETILEYLKNDCLGLLEVLQLFSTEVYNNTGINITECYTASSLSKKNYFKNYYNYKIPIYSLEKEIDEFIRNGYYGGRCEAFEVGKKINNPFVYDFTSLYPSIGMKFLPFDKPEEINLPKDIILDLELLDDVFGFCDVMVKTINFNIKPLHGYKQKNKLIFPHFKEWTLLKGLFTEEIKIGIKNGIYAYKFIKGYSFNRRAFLRDFFIDAFSKKAQAKKNNNKALALCYKIIANSGYGFWGFKANNRQGTKLFYDDETAFKTYLENDKLIDINTYGKYTFVKCEDNSKVKDYNVGIASAISSYGRIKIWETINDFEKKGAKVYYTDTDSLMTDLDLSKYPDLLQKYQPDGKGETLGSLKNVCNEEIDDFTSNHSFDELIIAGCKFYALKKIHNNKIHEINKLKGYKKDDGLTFNLFDKLINNKIDSIIQEQTQFKKEGFNISLNQTNKKFKVSKTKSTVV